MFYTIRDIPHSQQRLLSEVGDYRIYDESIHIKVSSMCNENFEFLVGIHELIEAYLTKKRGIPEPSILAFDIEFALSDKEGEAGDDPEAPYHEEHKFATKIEMQVCDELGLSWDDYSARCDEIAREN